MKGLEMGFKNLIRNLKYLRKVDLKDKFDEKHTISLIDSLKYEILDDLKELRPPIIKDVNETIHAIIESRASICRFGDGELNLIRQISIPFQTASLPLSERLITVLSSSHKNTFIAITRANYYSKKNISDIDKNFLRLYGRDFRDTIEKHISPGKTYYSAEVTLAYTVYKEYNYELYFQAMRKIWSRRKLTIICGTTIFDNIENNIFDNAESVDYQYAPSLNAFESYNDIFDSAKRIDKNNLIIIILGPTATVLAYDLSLLGYQALDFGHIAKSYDWFKKEKKINHIKDAFNFYDPD
ncbi:MULTISPECIES: GT-D fold domain-containing glycosyltransferase [Pectobacterium]|nr:MULTISPECIES: GT-D fold domain-containing glycosyltransferase [Pectobacterium]